MKTKRTSGQGLIEVLVGSLILITLAWLGLDVATLVLAGTANDGLAKSAARAAANQMTKQGASDAAQKCINHFATSSIITKVGMIGDLQYQDKKEVVIKTEMQVRPPASFPGFEVITFRAQAVEPIGANPADL